MDKIIDEFFDEFFKNLKLKIKEYIFKLSHKIKSILTFSQLKLTAN